MVCRRVAYASVMKITGRERGGEGARDRQESVVSMSELRNGTHTNE